jgi:hypothetical protein
MEVTAMMLRHWQLPAAGLPALSAFALLAVGIVSGCSGSHEESGVGAAYDALAKKLHDCRHEQDECRDDSDCSDTALALCDGQARTCEETAREAEAALREATHACRVAEEECEGAVPDRNANALAVCREHKHECMEPLKPPEPPCHAALEQCLDAARAKDLVATSDAPPNPSAAADGGAAASPKPGPGMKAMPRAQTEPEMACHAEVRTCMMMEKDPMRTMPPHCLPPGRPMPGDEDDGGVMEPEPSKDGGVPGHPQAGESAPGKPKPPKDGEPKPPKDGEPKPPKEGGPKPHEPPPPSHAGEHAPPPPHAGEHAPPPHAGEHAPPPPADADAGEPAPPPPPPRP